MTMSYLIRFIFTIGSFASKKLLLTLNKIRIFIISAVKKNIFLFNDYFRNINVESNTHTVYPHLTQFP